MDRRPVVHCTLNSETPTPAGEIRPRVCAVSYLNTLPLVWGMLHGPQAGQFDLTFAIPSACADRLRAHEADIGIVPCAEVERMQLDYLPDTCIACRGPVRSILLISKVPPGEIRTLAADSSSRSSVMLSRIIVAERYGATPQLLSHPPELEAMLARADAALVIGDPALRIHPESLPYTVLDLGAEWVELTGLPMVFAVWAGRRSCLTPDVARAFRKSWEFGMANLDTLAATQRDFSPEFARRYLTENVWYELGPRELEGMALFRRKVAELDARDRAGRGVLVP